jgi:hypothetical protein
MTVSWALAACELFEGGRGVNSMMVALLVAGIGVLLVGLLAIGFGIPVKEFSFGNTLILVGAVAACTGMMLVGLWTAVRELKNMAQRLGPDMRAGTALQSAVAGATPRDLQENEGFLSGGNEPALENPGHAEPTVASSAPSRAPWQEEAAARDRTRVDAPPAAESVEAAPAVKPKRNLLFSSLSRKERERAEARTADPSAIAAIDVRPAAPPVAQSDQMSPPATFDDAWPQSDRAKTAVPSQSRSSRAPSTFADAAAAAPAADRHPPVARPEDPPPVTVLKSGVVDGMAYSLYSDGSIEAQMPEGMMRFASIDELRSHLDQRP